MFERFTQDARTAVVGAQVEARSLGHGWIGTEHLLLAVLTRDGAAPTAVAPVLQQLGLDHAAVRATVVAELGDSVDDSAALRDLGIDLDDVRRRVEERFGAGALGSTATPGRPRWRRPWRRTRRACVPTGHIPFTKHAKRALELALREAMAAHDREIRSTHLVLGLMREGGMAARIVTRLGSSPETVRRAVLDQGRAA